MIMLNNSGEIFSPSRVTHTTQRPPTEWPTLQSLLRDISIEPLVDDSQIARAAGLLDEFHYLGAPNPVGERIWYAALDPGGEWFGVLLFTAAARRLRHRDEWIGWSDEQRRRRLPLLANNSRFLLLPDKTSPNLGSAVLSRATSRLSGDWLERYGHPVLAVETFVDPQRFRGTVYKAANWTPLGHNCPAIRERIESRLPDPGSPLLPWKNTPAAPPATPARRRNANG